MTARRGLDRSKPVFIRFGADGDTTERIDGERAMLEPGKWVIETATITRPAGRRRLALAEDGTKARTSGTAIPSAAVARPPDEPVVGQFAIPAVRAGCGRALAEATRRAGDYA